MRARWAFAVVAVLLLALVPPAGGLTEQERAGGWSGALPKDLLPGIAPRVLVGNITVPLIPDDNANATLAIRLYDDRRQNLSGLVLTLELYRWGVLGQEMDLDQLPGPHPTFLPGEGAVVNGSHGTLYVVNVTGPLPEVAPGTIVQVNVTIPHSAALGFYRVRSQLEFLDTSGAAKVARSRGHLSDAQWEAALLAAKGGKPVSGAVPGLDGLLPEAGFTFAPEDFRYVSMPNAVPDFGNFTTPTIRPGRSGTFNFTITNRYLEPIKNVTITIEIYMWATLESSKAIDRLGGPAPKFGNGLTRIVAPTIPVLERWKPEPITVDISTKDDTPKGTYFVKHSVEFEHNGTAYTMSSRGHFSSAQWEGFAYNNLYYQLNVSGIVPDSSFNVKDPVPLWPLGVLVGLCALFGALAVVFYLAEEHGPEYPRLKKALQKWTGKYEQRRRLLEQRLDELRREVDVADEDDERQ